MADVLVDTSVWIAFFRKSSRPKWRPALEAMLDDRSAVLLDVTVAELLVGARGTRERGVILDLARSLRRPRLDLAAWVDAGDLRRTLRQDGRTISLIDCVIAAVAARDGLLLWTLDGDFDPLVSAGVIRRFVVGRA